MSLCGLPLALTATGEEAVVTALTGGRDFEKRLGDLGVRVNQRLTVVHRQSCGRLVVAIGGGRFALGHGMARKILVLPPQNGNRAT